jgi:hypothetical protein
MQLLSEFVAFRNQDCSPVRQLLNLDYKGIVSLKESKADSEFGFTARLSCTADLPLSHPRWQQPVEYATTNCHALWVKRILTRQQYMIAGDVERLANGTRICT